ncbi:hypothetical protein V1517DRAFT_316593 [Lipomyces orientalis]|uniref:Uncharacterized protein n=1 Tax=Lipomyces orientalis TaxID=1233043 RepID=A0ACC3TU53_9ASCO
MDIAAGAVAPSGASDQPKSSQLVRSNSFQLHIDHSTTGSDGISPTATTSENEERQKTRRASSGSTLNRNTEQIWSRKLSTSSSVSFSSRLLSKRNSIRAFFGKSSISESSYSASSPACVPPASSNGPSTPQSNCSQLPPIDFTTADAAQTHSYYKNLPYSTAILQAVAVDTLAYNAHGALFTIVSKSSLERRTFVLLSCAILRYALNPSSTALPERVLLLSSESVAYASDDIPGRQYVLRVSERPERHQVEERTLAHVPPDEDILGPKKSPTSPLMAGSSARRSIFFHTNISTPTLWHSHHHDSSHRNGHHIHLCHHHYHHHIPLLRDEKTRTVLLVFDTAPEFMRWMTLARDQIKSQRVSVENKRYYLFQSATHESGKGDRLELSPPLFSESYSISCPRSTTTNSATAMTSSLPPSKRPSVVSISASTASQASQRPSPLSGARQNSSSSVQTMGSLALSKSSSSSTSLQESVNPIVIRPRPPPAARRESATFSALTRLTSLRRTASQQRQRSPEDSSGVKESALVDDDDGISSLSRSLGTNVRRKNKTKVTRLSPAGPPPSGPLPPIPTEQN